MGFFAAKTALIGVSAPANRRSRASANRHKTKGGRPKNPYAITDSSFWTPGGTLDCFAPIVETTADLAPSVPRKETDLRHRIFGLIMQAPGALTRGFIEACLVHEHGFRASDVTDALERLRAHDYASNEVKYLPLDAGEAKPVDVYCYRRLPTNDERKRLRAMFQTRRELLTPNVLRDAGEQYVRTMLYREGFTVHRLALGEASMADASCLDLFVKRDGVKYGVSVKNQREVVYPQSAAVFDVIARSRANEVAPFLIAPFISGEAKDACDERGVRYLELRAQILPCETRDKRPMRNVVRDLRPILGPTPYKYQPAPRKAKACTSGVHLETKK